MTQQLAEQKGYQFCGNSYCKYHPKECSLDEWNEIVDFAKKIKKEYKDADYAIVTGTKNWCLGSYAKALYGNEIFNKIWVLLRYDLDIQKAIIEHDKKLAEERYKKALEKIAQAEKKYQQDLELLKSMKK